MYGPKSDLGYFYTIPDSLCTCKKTIPDRVSVHTRMVIYGAASVMERSVATTIPKVMSHISDSFSCWHKKLFGIVST